MNPGMLVRWNDIKTRIVQTQRFYEPGIIWWSLNANKRFTAKSVYRCRKIISLVLTINEFWNKNCLSKYFFPLAATTRYCVNKIQYVKEELVRSSHLFFFVIMWKLLTICFSLVVLLNLCGELWLLIWMLVLAEGIYGKVWPGYMPIYLVIRNSTLS
jgi:hypothetical protein